MNQSCVIEHIKTADLIPYARNSRTHSDEQVAQIAGSIREFGFTNPVLIDADNGIIAGHGRVMAAGKLGFDTVPCIRLDYLTEAQKRAYIIADNRIALNSGWDEEMLKLELQELDDLDFNLDLIGFTDDELGLFLDDGMGIDASGLTDEDEVPEPPVTPVTKLGDVWLLGKHRLMCGDSTSVDAVEQLMAGQKADMVFTDPPYGIKVKMDNSKSCNPLTVVEIMGDDTTDVAVESYNIITLMGIPAIIWGANHFCGDAKLPNAKCWIAWNKQEKNNHIDQADCELAWTNIDSPARQFHHLWAGFRRDSEIGETRVHPTQKPVELIIEILDHFKKIKSDSILDLFGGSGSTLIACEKTNRQAMLMELDPKYCDVIIKRWQDFTGKVAIHEATGESFKGV